MENYDLFGDELGSGMLDGLGDLGSSGSNYNASNQPTGAGNMMQNYNNQQPQYTQIGQSMAPPTKMAPGGYPDYTSQYGQYGATGGQQQTQPSAMGGYPGSGPTRPMAGYPYPHQATPSPGMHYQDYSVQNQAGILRPPAPSQPHAPPPPRLVTPSPTSQQQFGGYRPPSQESLYLQQFPRWNDQQTASPYGTSSLPHHYPSTSSTGYRAPGAPPHAYPSSLPRPSQSMGQPPQTPQSAQTNVPGAPTPSVNSQQHNIPYMPRPQTPTSLPPQPTQPQYGQSMYGNSSNQYPTYHHSSSSSVGQLPGGPSSSTASSYPHHSQQQYSIPPPTPQHQYGNQYGQYYPGSGPPLGGQTPQTPQMSYPGSYAPAVPSANSSVPNGGPTYRPGYAQLPQLSPTPRQPTPSPRQPAPSPRPPSSTTPTIPPPSSQPSMPQVPPAQPNINTPQAAPTAPQPSIGQQPSSLQQLEQMVMPHVNKNSPSPKPHASLSATGVLSPIGGPKTPLSPSMSGPKTPMSPGPWQSGARAPAPPIASKPSYLHPQQIPSSPTSYGMPTPVSVSATPNIDNSIGNVRAGSNDPSDMELCGLSASLDTSTAESLPLHANSVKEESKPPTPLPTPQPSSAEVNGLPNFNEDNSTSNIDNTSSKDIPQTNASTCQDEETQRFSVPSTSNSESHVDADNSGASKPLSSPLENNLTPIPQYSPAETNNSLSNTNSLNSPVPCTTPQVSQPTDNSPKYTSPTVSTNASMNGTATENSQQQPPPPMNIQNGLSQPPNLPPNSSLACFSSPQSQPYTSSINSPQQNSSMMPPASHAYPTRFPTDPSSQPSFVNNYHNPGLYSGASYNQPGRPPVPPQYPLPPGAPGVQPPLPGSQPSERYNFEIHQIQQQLQHLYAVPPNPQTQMQINDLQERLRSLQQVSSPFPITTSMGPIPSGKPFGQMPMGQIPVETQETNSKSKKKKERKPREPKAPKPKKGKNAKNAAEPTENFPQPPTLPHDLYEFEDVPPEIPEKKPKKPRKPKEEKSPKPKKVKEPKPPKEPKTPKSTSRSRKKKTNEPPPENATDAASIPGEDQASAIPKTEETLDSEQKNGIGAAGITAAEGGSSTTPSGGDGDTSTQDAATENTTAVDNELATPEKPVKPKKPKLKSTSSKKRPSKTLLAFKNRKKRRRSDSEVSDIDRTPPPSPPPEEDSNKRRSGRNTQRKKYIDDIDLALSDEDMLIPNKAALKAIEASMKTSGSTENASAQTTQASTTPSSAPLTSPTHPSTSVDKTNTPVGNEESPSINKHNFFFVNTADEDTMIVQHILSMRMGKREIVPDSSDDEETNKNEKTEKQEETKSSETNEEACKENETPAQENETSKQEAETADKQNESPKEEASEPEKNENSEALPPSEEENKATEEKETTECKEENADNQAATSEEPNDKTEKKKRETQTVEVEEFYVKYKNFSYLHCEWKTEEELMKGDKRVSGKIKRFKQKLSNNANIFEFIEEEPFNPDYTEVDRVLDMSEVTDPATGKVIRNYLVKWRSLPYDESTWELEDDIDPDKLAHFRRFYECPKKDQWKPKKRPKSADWVKLDHSPTYKNANQLREYQLEGLNWLLFSWYNGRNCILADEMGLGKTIQSLTFIESVHRFGVRGPFLVIAPLSTVPNWQREFETWTDLNVVVYHGSVASRNMIQEYELFYRHPDNPQMNLKDCYKFNVLITTFEIVLTDVMELKDFPWRVCIIDEAHRLKNKNCKLLEGLRLLNMEHRVLLSGTPLQNNVQELFSLLNFLEPSQFNSDESFVKEFGDLKSETQVQKLQALLKPMMLRRLKEDVEKTIAPKEETIVEVELTNMQKKYYRAILERNFSFLSKGTSSANIPNLMNTMMELRKCCIHPYLLNGAEEQIQLDYRINHNLPESDPDLYYKALVHSSGKMVLIDKLLPKLKASGHRVLVFSQMVRCLDILEDYLIFRQYPYERLDGRIRGPVRQAAIDRYSRPDSDRFVFLLCTKAGGLGINLTAADTVIIYDSDWNPQNDLQAQARCHRIGQSKKVKIYRLICRNTYEREMFDRASLKLGLDKAVLQSMNTAQGGKFDSSANASKQLTKKEVEDLLKRGAYGAIMDEDNAGEKFCEEDIDVILERRTQVITLESGEKGSTFSKASFAATGIREDINVDDPDFWKKWAKKAEIDTDELVDKNELVIHEPRRRTQIKRYGHDEGVMDISELESSSDSDEEGNVGDRTRSGRGRKTRSGKGRRGRRGNFEDDFQIDDGVVEYGKWSKSECYKIERGLLTFGWKRWDKILKHGQFRNGWNEQHMEDCARLILLHCINNFRGDDKVRTLAIDLASPYSDNIGRNHSGLANPVSRGGRKGKKKEKTRQDKTEKTIEGEDWMKEEKYDSELHLDPTFLKHVSKNANKLLLRIRLLYYIKHEIIGSKAEKVDQDIGVSELDICPITLDSFLVDRGPVDWWDLDADSSLLVGTYKHGYEKYNVMRQDPALCFLNRCGPPDGSAVLAEMSEANEDEIEKEVPEEEDEESNNNSENKENGGDKPKIPDLPNDNVDSTESEKSAWPSTTDLNTRIRKLITAFQRYFKKEEFRNLQRARRMERKEKYELQIKEKERHKLEVHQKRWSKKEENEFYKGISTFGVQRLGRGQFDWAKFRCHCRLEKKFDDTLTEYFRAFYAMCKRICGQKLSDEEEFDLIQVPVDPLPEERARRTLERIDLLCKIRDEIIQHEKLDERLKLCLPSLDMPEWWIPGKHDKDLLIGAARHGLGKTDHYYLTDPDLAFQEIVRRHLAGEPLLDPAEKLAYKNNDKKIKPEPVETKRRGSDMVDIEIEDIKEKMEKKESSEVEDPANISNKIDDDTGKPSEDEKKETNAVSNSDSSTKCDDNEPSHESTKENKTTSDVPIKVEKDETIVEEDLGDQTNDFSEVPDKKSPDTSVKEEAPTSPAPTPVEPVETDTVKQELDTENEESKEDMDVSNAESSAPTKAETEGEKMESSPGDDPPKDSTPKPERIDTKSDDSKEKPTNEKESDDKGTDNTEMNEVQVEIKNELKITIKLPAEKMNRVEVQVKGSPKFSVPDPPTHDKQNSPAQSSSVEKEDTSGSTKINIPKFEPLLTSSLENSSSVSGNLDALGSLLNQVNPIRWPRDRAVQIRLEHIVYAVEKNEWPVSRFFSSAAMPETFEITPTGTPDMTPVRDTPTPISECSDLAPPEDLIMSLGSSNASIKTSTAAPTIPTSTPSVGPGSGRRGRRRRIAIDVETERAKLQALLNQSPMHPPSAVSHLSNPRLSGSLRRERTSTPTSCLNLSQDNDSETDGRSSLSTPPLGKSSKYQPPPPAHQNHPLAGGVSLLRNPQHRSQSPSQRQSPGFVSQAQSSTLDLSIKSSQKDVAAAAMSALSSLSSVTVTPVTIPSPKSSDKNSNGSAPMDLSGGLSKRARESPTRFDKPIQDSPLNFGGPPKKVSKLENMLDKLKKRKLGDKQDSSEPLPLEKDKKKKKLDEIVFGLSAAKGTSVFSPPIDKKSHSQSSVSKSNVSPLSTGVRSGTPSPQVSQAAKDIQGYQNLFTNANLLNALSMINKDMSFKEFSKLAGAQALGSAMNKKDSSRFSANSQDIQLPKSDLSRLAEIGIPKFDFSHDAKVNKWLAEHANLTPERPPSPEFIDRRRRRPRTDPTLMDWNKISGNESIPVVHRVSGKRVTGPKAPQLRHLAQWLAENPSYDVDPKWVELVKERGNLPNDLQKRLSGEKKKGPGRPPTLTTPPPTSSSSPATTTTSSSNNAFTNVGPFSSMQGLSGLNPNLLASFGALDPKNPLGLMPFGGLGSLGNSLGGLANLGMGNLGISSSLFGLNSPFMGMGGDISGLSSGAQEKSSTKEKVPTTSSTNSKKEEKSKKSSTTSSNASSAHNVLSNSFPFLFPNPGLMYNPLGLGSFPLGGGMTGSPFGNLSQGSLLNGLAGESSKKSSKTNASAANPMLAAGLAGLNIPNLSNLSKKDLKEFANLGSMTATRSEKSKSGSQLNLMSTPVSMSTSNNPDDSDDESLKSLMGNHQDDLPDDEPTPENAERVILKESKELEKEMAQQKMETRREKRLRDREERGNGGLTSAERQLLMERKKERLAKEEMPSGRTTRRSAASRSRLEEAVTKMKEATEAEDSSEKDY